MQLKLIRLSKEYRKPFEEMMEEWIEYNDSHDANHSPYAIFKNDYHDFDYYVSHLDSKEDPERGFVADTTWFCYDEEICKMIGAINIRHRLNDYLLQYGGHLGDGIRPSLRRKGYATAMIGLGLKKCQELGIDRVLICCDKDNIGSARSIMNNGGRLENEVSEEDGTVCQRYWIDNVGND